MKIIHTILVHVILICNALTHTMEQPSVTAALILLDPEHANNSALQAFENPHLNQHPAALALHAGLAAQALPRLEKILSSQTPLPVIIHLPQEYSQTLSISDIKGLYVRKKRADEGSIDFITPGTTEFIPDPYTCSTSHSLHFDEVYSGPNNSHLFQYVTQKGYDLRIWDTQTGECLTNGQQLKEKLKKKYAHLVALDSDFPEPIIYAVHPTTSLMWFQLSYKPKDSPLQRAAGTYNYHTDRIDYIQLGDRLDQASSSGNLIPIFEHASGRTMLASTEHPSTALELCRDHAMYDLIISPNDRYLLYKKRDIDQLCEIHCYNVTNKTSHLLVHGDYKAVTFSPSGHKVIIELPNTLKVFDLKMKTKIIELKKKFDTYHFESLFDPTETEVLICATEKSDTAPFLIRTFNLETHAQIACSFAATQDTSDFTFCNDGKYLLLPNSQLIMQAKGLASLLSLRELIGLLILEKQKRTHQPYAPQILKVLQQNRVAKITELITRRYPIASKRLPLSLPHTLKLKRAHEGSQNDSN